MADFDAFLRNIEDDLDFEFEESNILDDELFQKFENIKPASQYVIDDLLLDPIKTFLLTKATLGLEKPLGPPVVLKNGSIIFYTADEDEGKANYMIYGSSNIETHLVDKTVPFEITNLRSVEVPGFISKFILGNKEENLFLMAIGKVVFCAGSMNDSKGNYIDIRGDFELKVHTEDVRDMSVSPNGDLLATVANDGTFVISRLSSGSVVFRKEMFKGERTLSSVSWFNQECLAFTTDDGHFTLYDLKKDEMKSHYVNLGSNMYSHLHWKEKSYLIGGENGKIKLWDFSGDKGVVSFPSDSTETVYTGSIGDIIPTHSLKHRFLVFGEKEATLFDISNDDRKLEVRRHMQMHKFYVDSLSLEDSLPEGSFPYESYRIYGAMLHSSSDAQQQLVLVTDSLGMVYLFDVGEKNIMRLEL